MLQTLAQGLHDERRSGEVHIRNPEGQQVVAPVALAQGIGLERARAAALYDTVEIVVRLLHGRYSSPRACLKSSKMSSMSSRPTLIRRVVSKMSSARFCSGLKFPNMVLYG